MSARTMTPSEHLERAYDAVSRVRERSTDRDANEHYRWLAQWHATMALAESFRPVSLTLGGEQR